MGRIAWNRRSRPCLAEPPAESPSTIYNRVPRTRRHQRLVDDLFGDGRVGIKKCHQPLVGDGADDALDLRNHELRLGLRFEAGVRVLDGENANQAFADIIPAQRGILVFEEVVGLGILVDCAGERGAEAGCVSSTVGVGNGIGKAEYLVVVAVVVLQNDVHKHVILHLNLILRFELHRAPARKHNRLRVHKLLVFPQLAHKFLNPLLV